ncbi:hypothetical protein LV457_06625 [Mycobacterium sp. MYCO198283]|uniref:hypothetical protein n=1 Tax=Mycobacterium sp. MYCO198283 TaxID=2883505 RepID=UPI001E2FA5C1|nr:hypothetical protein [Mycobacterium sp. MYCO198283]MCG5431964.1 hypothetical protein [Mycobacterium sp. MYCO198283]
MEGDAGTGRLNPTDHTDDAAEDVAPAPESPTSDDPSGSDLDAAGATDEQAAADETAQPDAPAPPDGASFLSRGWIAAVAVLLTVLALGVGTLGYLTWRANRGDADTSRNEAAAAAAAKNCVAATHAPDVSAMAASQQKIIECSTGDFGVQANFFAPMLVEAYQAADVKLQIEDMHAAVEKHNDDGSMDVLVSFRVKMSNVQSADQEIGYRLRARMAPDAGQFKVARLDTVSA